MIHQKLLCFIKKFIANMTIYGYNMTIGEYEFKHYEICQYR